MNPEATYLQHLDDIKRIAAFVARTKRLNADETDEFIQNVCVRLFDNDYAILRQFRGLSELTTYLMTVIQHLHSEWRVAQWGKWRPSAEARRLGDTAITLERLITRDGFTFAEAVRTMTTRADPNCTIAELEAIYVRLPPRNPRPMLVSEEVSPDTVAVEADADERVESRDRERSARRCVKALEEALQNVGIEDRAILQLRFKRSRRVPEIARTLNLDQKKVYKRLDKLYAILRKALVAAGVSAADVEKLLVPGDQEIRLDLLSNEEKDPFGPSNDTGEDGVKGGGGRL